MHTEMKCCQNVVIFGLLGYENICIDTKMKFLSILFTADKKHTIQSNGGHFEKKYIKYDNYAEGDVIL